MTGASLAAGHSRGHYPVAPAGAAQPREQGGQGHKLSTPRAPGHDLSQDRLAAPAQPYPGGRSIARAQAAKDATHSATVLQRWATT